MSTLLFFGPVEPVDEPPVAVRGDRPGLVLVSGDVDVANSTVLFDVAMAAAAENAHCVTLELSDLRFIDSCGLGAVVGIRNEVLAHDGQMQILGISDALRRTFAFGGLEFLLAER
jgi:anti-sigma B factor antagonist